VVKGSVMSNPHDQLSKEALRALLERWLKFGEQLPVRDFNLIADTRAALGMREEAKSVKPSFRF
jgi:hypothetical protein